MMNRIAPFLASSLLVFAIGCGSKTTENAAVPAESARMIANPALAAAGNPSSPTDVVSQFLDSVRRGGKDSNAGEFLTSRAQAELRRIGRTVQPIGSPDAKFSVTRAEMVPDEPGAALVHSIWSEPNGDGSAAQFQVVWALQRESASWRISGLALEIAPGQDPQIIDFENGALMAQLLDGPDSPATASAPGDTTISR